MAEKAISSSSSYAKGNGRRGTSVYSKFLQSKARHPSDCDLESLLGPPPDLQLGPKACICGSRDYGNDGTRQEIFLHDPSSQFLHWKEQPRNILIIKKINDNVVTEDSKLLARWLIEEKKMKIFVEAGVTEEPHIKDDEKFSDIKDHLSVYKKDESDDRQSIDLIVCLGGDGTLLHASSLFQESCPPIIAFHLGTLGFLMPFSFDNFKYAINQTLHENIGLTLRARLKSQIIEGDDDYDDDDGEIQAEHLTLNEVVIDRGPVASLVNLDIKCNGQYLTTLIGDGLIIATATGSTAYAAATGASMIHPSVPGIVLTPICPHSLSFRPIVVPAGIELKVKVSAESRRSAWASFDGRNQIKLSPSTTIRITTSVYPIPCISHKDHLRDWFDSLAECLQWNTRDYGSRKYKSNGDI